ncbi:GNAT family N-acetyltransferase [Halomarina litorea]|uniref:GNAT family N-acetyltransferase n=1 Tax=Halomarina litorea TaxID=2961595 RepID=UPI0020C5AD9D|nr:GNAT family N-acetyltransferase [Halomarina sp. BCD28]
MPVDVLRGVVTTTPRDADATPTVRQAERGDLLEVFRIERRVFPQPWPFEAFERFLDEPGFMVAECAADGDSDGSRDWRRGERAVAGYVVADLTPNFGRDIGHVKDLAVDPEFQGRGVGTLLLNHALATVEAQGAHATKLEVREDNDPALALYRRHGFEHRRTVPRYYADGTNALVLVRTRE